VGSQSVSDRLGELHFPEITITVGPDVVDVAASDASLAGQGASDLRHCIDRSNCPDSSLQAASNGNGNGNVESGEVDAFEANAISGLNIALALGGGSFAEFGDALRQLVTIDGSPARQASVERFEIDEAEGSVGSAARVLVSFTLRIQYPGVNDANHHTVSIARSESGLDLADRIVVAPAGGWRIKEDSIAPAGLQAHYNDGRISGSQRELEGPEPLTFELEKKAGLSGWGWFLLISLLLLVVGAVLYYLNKRRRKV